MRSEWTRYTVDEIAADIPSSIAIGPFGSRMKSDSYVSEGVPVVRGNNIVDGQHPEGEFVYITEEKALELKSSMVVGGDLVFPHRGAIGKVSLIPQDATMILSSSLMKLTPNKDKCSSSFLFYFFRSNRGAYELLKNASTVGTPGIGQPLTSLKQIEIDLPPIKEQKAIAHILGTLDNKIELNQKMNQTLEDIAKAIFKSWFVDFDPVRAKAEGRPTGLPPEISELFPDELVDSEIGEIPKGWDIQPAESLFDITIGRTPPRKESQWFSELETDVPWASIRDMGDCGTFISKTSEYLTHDAVSKHRMHKLPVGSVLVSFKLTVGRVAITTENMTTNEAIAHFPPSDAFPYPNFAYFYLKGFGYESLGSTSSIATAVNSKMIKAIPFIVATSDLTAQFEETVAPMMDRIRVASEETHVLSELRDTLLPKLISGELRIPDAEKLLQEAGI